MFGKFMRPEGPHLSLLFKFKTRLFSGDDMGEGPSYNHLVFPLSKVSSCDYTLIKIFFNIVTSLWLRDQ
jgi:hypothetical protein